MKISKLIKELKKVKKEHGDIDTYCWPYDGQSHLCEIGDLKPCESPMANNKKVLFIQEQWD